MPGQSRQAQRLHPDTALVAAHGGGVFPSTHRWLQPAKRTGSVFHEPARPGRVWPGRDQKRPEPGAQEAQALCLQRLEPVVGRGLARLHGCLRVVAADGTCVRVARWAENINAYGWGPCRDGTVVMARCVALFSTATRQVLDVVVGRYDEGERAQLLRALGALKRDDVLVLDRGYPAWWMFALLQARNIAFCVRIQDCGWPVVRQFLAMEQDDWVIAPHELSARVGKQLNILGFAQAQQVALRLIRVRLPNGKWEVLATSLLDQHRFPACEFAALYGQRWSVEESFKLIKHRLDLEGFSGELPHAIEQEIYAKALMHHVAQALCSEAAGQHEEEKRANWKVNRAYAVKNVGPVVVNWFKGCKHHPVAH